MDMVWKDRSPDAGLGPGVPGRLQRPLRRRPPCLCRVENGIHRGVGMEAAPIEPLSSLLTNQIPTSNQKKTKGK